MIYILMVVVFVLIILVVTVNDLQSQIESIRRHQSAQDREHKSRLDDIEDRMDK